MAADLTASLVLALLVFSFSVSADQRIIRAEPGENVTLTCRADENKDVIGVEWSRPDLKSDEHVLLYRDKTFDKQLQSSSFKNRVDLMDMKNGDVSLVLKNVTTDDTGRYECQVVQRGNNRRKRSLLGGDPICIIDLRVEPDQKITAEPGDNKGCEGAGNKEVKQRDKRAAPNTDNCNSNQRVEPGNKEKQKMDGGNKDGVNRTGLIVGLSVFAVVAVLIVAVVAAGLYKRPRGSSPRSNPPPAAADVEKKLTGPDESNPPC